MSAGMWIVALLQSTVLLTAVYFVLQDYHAEDLLSAGLWIVALLQSTVLLTAVYFVLQDYHADSSVLRVARLSR
jgi:ABC-type transporter Mla maintaining outer membrane lipid asymmetry permease subunit MlaE